MSRGHGHHHHDHRHHHGHGGLINSRWMIGIVLNAVFVVAEVAAGLVGHSMALLADAGHNLSDVMSLALAAGAAWLARRPAAPHRTYGFAKAPVLAALANSILLVFACGFIASEAIGRLRSPTQPATGLMMGVAAAGVLINGLTAALFTRGRREDVNVRSAFQHMAGDAAISAGVVLAGLAILLTGKAWIDPVVSFAIVAVILVGSWGVLREAFDLAMDAAPAGVDVASVREFLEACDGVSEVHDLHIWPLSTTETALTAHLVRATGGDDGFLKSVCQQLHARYGVGHATLQIEVQTLVECEELHA